MGFVQANKKVHKVEDQWHYPILTKHGYIPQDKERIGFVRSYEYIHPETGDVIIASTGANCDHWRAKDAGGFYYSLEGHLNL